MTIKNQNFEIFAGENKNLRVTVRDKNGNVVNLTGSVVKWSLASTRDKKVNKDSSNGGVVITDPTAGIFTVILVPNDTIALNGTYLHEAEIIDAQGNSSIVLTGSVNVIRSISRIE